MLVIAASAARRGQQRPGVPPAQLAAPVRWRFLGWSNVAGTCPLRIIVGLTSQPKHHMNISRGSRASAGPTPRMRDAFSQLLESVGDTPFRRQDVAGVLYPLTIPRDRKRADQLAAGLIQDLARCGELVRHGHLHWKRVGVTQRRLLSGRPLQELSHPVVLELATRVPRKWVAIDLETGRIYLGDASGWSNPSPEDFADARTILSGRH